ncbi:hypothetical protein [Actinoplanes sp. NPDC051494]|uniref:hypothetical protein n=1 Tax=Actinoplanes sp. NPDC051494 TaxID=3363907 RepID=UPI0037A4C70C
MPAVQSCLAPFFASAEAALVPTLAPADRLVTVNSLNGQISDVARLIGAALGGTVAALGGIPCWARPTRSRSCSPPGCSSSSALPARYPHHGAG